MRCLVTLIFLLLVGSLLSGSSLAQGDRPSEYQVKAAFLYNFANFVEWPATAFADSTTPFVIGILGEDPFDGTLEDIVQGEAVSGRLISVVHLRTLDEVNRCQILYSTASQKDFALNIIRAVGHSPVLTVGEAADFSELGGVIEFFTSENRIKFEINMAAARQAGLKVSSKLQKVAERLVEK